MFYLFYILYLFFYSFLTDINRKTRFPDYFTLMKPGWASVSTNAIATHDKRPPPSSLDMQSFAGANILFYIYKYIRTSEQASLCVLTFALTWIVIITYYNWNRHKCNKNELQMMIIMLKCFFIKYHHIIAFFFLFS